METVAFDQIGRTRKLEVITILSSMGVFMDGYALSIFSSAYLFLGSSFLNRAIYVSFAASSIYIGMFAGAIVFGRISDAVGRKRIYTYDLILTALFLALTGFSGDLTVFFIFQLLAGVGIGADYPISSSIQAEFSPRKSRGRYLIFNIFSWTLGSIAFYAVSIPLVIFSGHLAWRLMYITAAAIPLIVVTLRRSMPESPYWLVKSGDAASAEVIVSGMAHESGYERVTVPEVQKGKTSFRELRKYVPLIMFTSIAWFAYDVSSYGVWNYTPSLFVSAGGTYTGTILATMLEEIPVIAGTLLCLYSIDRVGRKSLESLGFAMAGISLLAFAFISLRSALPFAYVFMAFAMMHFFHNIGPTNITFLYPVEIFPTRIRATAMGISTAASRIGAILGVFAFPILLSNLSLKYGLVFFALFEFIGLTVTLILAPETTGKPIM